MINFSNARSSESFIPEIFLCANNNKLHIHIKPNARENAIIAIKNNIINVTISAPPDKNEANIELIKFFSKLLKRQVRIIKGFKSKNKILILQ